jgi:hypothetical protein
MKDLASLITQARVATENEDTGSTDFGIQDSEFIQYFNDAQYKIQSLIVQQHPDVFSEEIEITCDGSEKYDIKTEISNQSKQPILIDNKILNVEYSSTGNADDYYVISETSLKNRAPGSDSSPISFIRSSGKIIPVGKPSSGKLRITYIKRVKELVASVVTAASQTTTSELPEITERYLLAYVEWKILKRDSSIDSKEAIQELKDIEADIIKSYRHINDDIQLIPSINQSDDWSLN